MGSQVERGSAFGNFSDGGYSGFLINSFDPELNYGISDFDVRHQINANWLAELPFGQGKRCAARTPAAFVNAVHRRLVDRRPDALDQRLPVQRRTTAARAGRRTGTCRATRCWSIRTGCPTPKPRRTRSTAARARSPIPTEALNYFRFVAAGRTGRPQPAARRRLLHDRSQPQQGVRTRHSPTTGCASAGTCST